MDRRLRICQHCDAEFPVASTGRPPKFCSSTCRKNAWHAERTKEAVTVAVAKALAAERRRSNRGNETPAAPDIRGNETPPLAGVGDGDFLLAPPAPAAPVDSVLPDAWRAPERRPLSRQRMGTSMFPTLWDVPDDQGQPDA